jgi:hypothetical protein
MDNKQSHHIHIQKFIHVYVHFQTDLELYMFNYFNICVFMEYSFRPVTIVDADPVSHWYYTGYII